MNSSPYDPAELFEEVAQQLDLAAAHARTAARHFRDRNIPRGCAHAYAAQGHLHVAQGHIDHRAVVHAEKSLP